MEKEEEQDEKVQQEEEQDEKVQQEEEQDEKVQQNEKKLLKTFTTNERNEEIDFQESQQYFQVVHERKLNSKVERRIAIAISDPKISSIVIDWTVKNIVNRETDLIVLLHVRPLPVIPGMSLWGPLLAYDDLIEKAEESNIAKSLSILQKSVKMLNDQEINVEAVTMRGSIAEELVTWINDQLPDLVVLGTSANNQLGPIKLFNHLTGQESISKQVLSLSRCPTLFVTEPRP